MSLEEFDRAWNLLRDLKWHYDLHSSRAQKGEIEQSMADDVDRFVLRHMADVFARRTSKVVEREKSFHTGEGEA